MVSDTTVRHVTVGGSADEMGAAHGEECRDQIKALFDMRREIIFSQTRRLERRRLQAICEDLWSYIAFHHDGLAAEVDATAAAAGLAAWQLVIAGAYTDVLDLCREDQTMLVRDECTVAISTGGHFIAGTWDSHPGADIGLLLLERHPLGGPATLALTTAGWPAQQGINESNMAFAITNLTPAIVNPDGLPYIAANALLAASPDPVSFAKLAASERFCSGHSYLAVNGKGAGLIVDTTGDGVTVETVERIATKANHYRESSSLDDNRLYKDLENSRAREAEFSERIQLATAAAEFEGILRQTRLVNRTDSSGPTMTCAHFFLDASKRELWYQRGPASGKGLYRARM